MAEEAPSQPTPEDIAPVPDSPPPRAPPTSLAEAIRFNLLTSSAELYADVTLVANDGGRVPAVRALLGVRSPYFRSLFFDGNKDQKQTEIAVNASGDALREVVQYAYTDDCNQLKRAAEISRKAKAHSSHPKRGKSLKVLDGLPAEALAEAADQLGLESGEIMLLIELILTANQFGIVSLAKKAGDAVAALVDAVPTVTCLVLETVKKHSVIQKVSPVVLKTIMRVIRQSPQQCLLVEDFRQTLKRRKGKSNTAPLAVAAKTSADAGVLLLSAESLEEILKDGDLFTSETYLFQVLYFWATSGVPLSALRDKSNATAAPNKQSGGSNKDTAAKSGLKKAGAGGQGKDSNQEKDDDDGMDGRQEKAGDEGRQVVDATNAVVDITGGTAGGDDNRGLETEKKDEGKDEKDENSVKIDEEVRPVAKESKAGSASGSGEKKSSRKSKRSRKDIATVKAGRTECTSNTVTDAPGNSSTESPRKKLKARGAEFEGVICVDEPQSIGTLPLAANKNTEDASDVFEVEDSKEEVKNKDVEHKSKTDGNQKSEQEDKGIGDATGQPSAPKASIEASDKKEDEVVEHPGNSREGNSREGKPRVKRKKGASGEKQSSDQKNPAKNTISGDKAEDSKETAKNLPTPKKRDDAIEAPPKKKRRQDGGSSHRSKRRVGKGGKTASKSERWEAAKRLSKHINLERLKPSFIIDYVEKSGLVSKERITQTYQQQALEGERGRPLFDGFRGGSVWQNGSKTLTGESIGYQSHVLDSPWIKSGRHSWTFKLEREADASWIGLVCFLPDAEEFFGNDEFAVAFQTQGELVESGRRQKRLGVKIYKGMTFKMILNLSRKGTLTVWVGEGLYHKERSLRAFNDLKMPWRGFLPAVYIKKPASITLLEESHYME